MSRDRIRAGLMKGRVRAKGARDPDDPYALPFTAALEQASREDLEWALNLLVMNPNRLGQTHREWRMKAISGRLRQMLYD